MPDALVPVTVFVALTAGLALVRTLQVARAHRRARRGLTHAYLRRGRRG